MFGLKAQYPNLQCRAPKSDNRVFKKEIRGRGRIIACDCNPLAPALYAADKYYIVPSIDEPGYFNAIMEICIKERIRAVISLIDPELSMLANKRKELELIGVTAIVSPYETCELWLDKYAAYRFLQANGFKTAKTYVNLPEFEADLKAGLTDFPVILKPRKGSASLNISIADNMDEAKSLLNSRSGMLIQEYLSGKELGVDVYRDLVSREIIAVFAKEKLSMRSGETDKAKSINPEELFPIVEALVTRSDLIGPVDMDVFYSKGEYLISEINPRFGGGYPLAYECGINFPKYILNNLSGVANKPESGNYGENVYMMKHDVLTVKKEVEIGVCDVGLGEAEWIKKQFI